MGPRGRLARAAPKMGGEAQMYSGPRTAPWGLVFHWPAGWRQHGGQEARHSAAVFHTRSAWDLQVWVRVPLTCEGRNATTTPCCPWMSAALSSPNQLRDQRLLNRFITTWEPLYQHLSATISAPDNCLSTETHNNADYNNIFQRFSILRTKYQ